MSAAYDAQASMDGEPVVVAIMLSLTPEDVVTPFAILKCKDKDESTVPHMMNNVQLYWEHIFQ